MLLSGRGSNFAAILGAIERGELLAEVALCLSNRADAGGLTTARERGIPAVHLSRPMVASDDAFSAALLTALTEHQVDLVALAGYLKPIPSAVVAAYRGRIVNIHPSLLPSFGGAGMYGRHVHEAVLRAGCKVSGATVHLVDDGYDTGRILAQSCVPVLDDDTPETLAARVLAVEHRIFPQTLARLLSSTSVD